MQSQDSQTEEKKTVGNNQDKLYKLMQANTYPTADSSSYIDNEDNGFRAHAWSDE